MPYTLKEKTILGIGWSFIDNLANQGVSFIVGLVLANLLTPQEFGVIAIIMIFIAIANSIVDSGFSSALIRKRDCKSIDYNTVFYFNLLVSVVLYVILYFLSPVISSFFAEPILEDVTRVISLILIINALGIVPRTIFVRKIDFKTQAKFSLISSLVSGVIGILLAIYGYGVWTLVIQQLLRQGLNTFFLCLYSKWTPILEFSLQSFKELFGFGSKLLLSGLLDTLWKDIYQIVIGRIYSTATLGLYERAKQFNVIFSSNLTSVISRVSYPILSSIQDEDERLKQAYRKVIKTTMLVSTALMFGMAACARPMILTLIGYKWIDCVEFLQILCFSGVLYPLHSLNLNILQVKGRSDLFLKLEIIKKIIALVPIFIGIYMGIWAMLWCSLINSYVSLYLNCHYSAPLINYSIKEQIKDLIPIFSINLIVAAVMFVITLLTLPNIILLFLQIFVGLTLAVIIYEKRRLPEYVELKNIAYSLRSKMKIINKYGK